MLACWPFDLVLFIDGFGFVKECSILINDRINVILRSRNIMYYFESLDIFLGLFLIFYVVLDRLQQLSLVFKDQHSHTIFFFHDNLDILTDIHEKSRIASAFISFLILFLHPVLNLRMKPSLSKQYYIKCLIVYALLLLVLLDDLF